MNFSRRRFLKAGALWLPALPSIVRAAPGLAFFGKTSGAGLDPVATAWEARVIANGGTDPSAAYVSAVSALVAGLKSDGIWSNMIFVHGVVPGPTVGTNPPAASCYAPNTPILVGPSVNLLLSDGGTNPASNWPAAGSTIISLNGITNWTSDVAATSTAIWSSATNIGFSYYMVSNPSISVVGCTNNSVGTDSTPSNGGAWSTEIGSCCGTFPSFTPGFTTGLFSFNRNATNNANVYGANSSNSPSTLKNSTSTDSADPRQNTYSFYFHGRNGPSVVHNGNYNLSFLALHTYLTLAQFTSLYSRVQAFRTAIGGGFV